MIDKAQKTKILMENFNKFLNETNLLKINLEKYYNFFVDGINKIYSSNIVYVKNGWEGKEYRDGSTGLKCAIDLVAVNNSFGDKIMYLIETSGIYDPYSYNGEDDDTYNTEKIFQNKFLEKMGYTHLYNSIHIYYNHDDTSKKQQLDNLRIKIADDFAREKNPRTYKLWEEIESKFETLSPEEFTQYISTLK